jgi:hypothetical protein
MTSPHVIAIADSVPAVAEAAGAPTSCRCLKSGASAQPHRRPPAADGGGRSALRSLGWFEECEEG